jgi:type II secretion system protein L
MSESLIIQLRTDGAPRWMVCNDDGHVLVNAVSGELAQAVPLSVGAASRSSCPASDVLITESDAPAKSAAKLAQVIPYALEERVADEIENLHFAIGERSAETGAVPVAVVARHASKAGSRNCAPPACNPQAIYSEAQLLPDMPGQLIALLDGESLVLRTAEGVPLIMPARSIRDAFEMRWPRRSRRLRASSHRRSGCCCTWARGLAGRQVEGRALRERFTGVKVQMLSAGRSACWRPPPPVATASISCRAPWRWPRPAAELEGMAESRRCSPARCCACTGRALFRAHAASKS